jgi:uncharacterized NAD(P)/FAD-binding protein YdhS
VVIVGAGFSGAAVAINLLEAARQPLRLVVANRSGQLARGLAYGTASPRHLLNVPAGRMSLFPSRPEDFLAFLRRDDPAAEAGDFVSRQRYGDYLQTRLGEAMGRTGVVRFEHWVAEAVDVQRVGDGRLAVHFAEGEALLADRVVLAIGHYPPAIPAVLQAVLQAVGGDPAFIGDPWKRGALEGIDPDKPVLLVGTGLTMVDMALELADRLHYVGPFLKGQYWESIAVPELSEHAAQLAQVLVAGLEAAH